ncbi:thiamine-phosphate kinase [Synechococcus sp. BDU 130192]|uniref:thiamine-phosphate kinase n=2 Tax=Synechococcus sp. BDU 130192 TaxID=2042059 RepID=UPI000C086E28|nr:thiamine-phosphate kinase [Synechococcus sp. BDU 130192]
MAEMKCLKDFGEAEILQRLQRFCPAEIIGDDGAVLGFPPGQNLVVTTDVLVDGVHFGDRTMPPEKVGWRAVAANLSDLAAMGATPIGITVGLSLPPETPILWLDQLYQGLAACLGRYSTPLVGGDLTRSPVKTIGITAFGVVSPHRAIQRSTAKVGDVILVTGCHGDSHAGLELLLHGDSHAQTLSIGDRQALIRAHQTPQPRLDVLAYLNPSDSPPAGMDSSDGLADAVLQICQRSGVGAVVEAEKIPLSPALRRYQNPETALRWALYGGEDFELVLCLPPTAAEQLLVKLSGQGAIIGQITAEQTVALANAAGQTMPLSQTQTFQHFA